MTAGMGSIEMPPFKTEVASTPPRKVVARNIAPDIPFDRSINPYRGCEHGCIYCFARPTHAFLGLSPGLDFETKLFMKPDAPGLLERELSARNYEPRTIAIGTNTDPYQPIERRHQVMRRILEVLERAGHPVGIVTKSRPDYPRHRHPRAHGRAASMDAGRYFGDHARYRARPRRGTARADAAAPPRGVAAACRRRAFPPP